MPDRFLLRQNPEGISAHIADKQGQVIGDIVVPAGNGWVMPCFPDVPSATKAVALVREAVAAGSASSFVAPPGSVKTRTTKVG